MFVLMAGHQPPGRGKVVALEPIAVALRLLMSASWTTLLSIMAAITSSPKIQPHSLNPLRGRWGQWCRS
jgi:hypothetical protein